IEHAEPNARGEEANQSGVNCALRQIALLNGFDVGLVIMVVVYLRAEVNAFVIHAALERNCRRLRLCWAKTVAFKDIAHRAAIGDNVSLELPRATQSVL